MLKQVKSTPYLTMSSRVLTYLGDLTETKVGIF